MHYIYGLIYLLITTCDIIRPTDVEKLSPRVGMATPERSVETVVQTFANDEMQ